MTRKQKALKALLVLGIIVALCMFFARTVQTITTPKVQRISATRGKLEQKISLTGTVYFPSTTEYKVEDAKKLGITIEKVNIRAGTYVEKGDVLFTAYATEYESKMATLKTSYTTKVKEMATEYAAHVRIQQSSEQNVKYNDMLSSIDDYYTARYQVISQAIKDGYTLPDDESTWSSITDAGEDLAKTIADFVSASDAMDQSVAALRQLYKSGVDRVGDETFEYIKKMDGFRGDIADLSKQMIELDALNHSVTSVIAPHSGYITAFDLKIGDTYDGIKAAYTMSAEDSFPTLRVDISSVTKTLSKGNKVNLTDTDTDAQITEIQTAADGKKYAIIQLDENTLREAGGIHLLLSNTAIPMTLTYKAAKNSTLLPASCVRTDGDNSSYIYVVTQRYGGILDSSGYILQKQPVTVLEKTDSIVSVSEDLSYIEIADREDRTLTEGQAVMDYVD